MIVEISGGELATRAESEEALLRHKIRHSVLWDDGNRNHKSYGITSWPAAYLIGPDGKVFWNGNPSRMQARPEDVQQFRTLLNDKLQAAKVSR